MDKLGLHFVQGDNCTKTVTFPHETRDTMVLVSNITQLPDEIICHIFSLLPIRRALVARLSTLQWLYLPDYRSVLQFDPFTVFGKEIVFGRRPKFRSAFVKVVDRFMQQVWVGNKIRKLAVEFALTNEHASYLDTWIATSTRMGAEEILVHSGGISNKEVMYVFPTHLLHPENAPCLKRLSLTVCVLSLSFESRSWLRNLTTLHLNHVRLGDSGIHHILSAASNLLSLALSTCHLPQVFFINGQLPRLKKLTLKDSLLEIKLNCPSLEVFEYPGHPCRATFVGVPVLRQVTHDGAIDSVHILDHFTRNAPKLEALSLRMSREVQPLLSNVAGHGLKKMTLHLVALSRAGFDLLTITYILNACPFLEILHLRACYFSLSGSSQQREYPDKPHYQLKKVEIIGATCDWNAMELATYIVKNAVALEQMVIEAPTSRIKQEGRILQQLQEKINPTARVIIVGRNTN